MSGALACEAARSRRVEVCGLDLHLLEWGPAARSGVLLLHGGGARAHWFDAVYHHLVLDRPEVFVREVRGFLDGLDAGGADAVASASGWPAAS